MDTNQQIEDFLQQCLEGTDCFVVSFKVKPTNNYKIYLDSDAGFTLEKCIRVNRELRRRIEEAGLYPEGDFSLEVSSPGVDEPLRLHRQYLKNVGRILEVELNDPESPGYTGRMVAADEEKIVLESLPRGRRTSKTAPGPVRTEIPFTDIKKATVVIEF